jgi:biotin carboxyl carrier protein
MARNYKSVLVEQSDGHDGFKILAPAVGIYYRAPEIGAFMKTGSLAGLFKRLNTLYHLRIPENVSGFVHHIGVNNIANPVEFRQELFFLVPGQNIDVLSIEATEKAKVKHEKEKEIPEGMFALSSPTDGIFYRKPNPESPAYVEEGDTIRYGKTMGLVEVMKSFNQLKYNDPDMPPQARICKILVEDAAEIKVHQPIFWLEPVE